MTILVLAPGSQGPVQPHSGLTIDGGTPSERDRMNIAIERFAEVGLDLPPLHILFRAEPDACRGRLGYFSPSDEPWQITICSDIDSIYEHELAHAWERASLSDERRRWFVARRGLPTWSDNGYRWNQRGVEAIAVTIQQGLAGLQLPPVLSDGTIAKLEDFEMLTGRVAPRLVVWIEQREVSCAERPTRLSLVVPDVSGRVCQESS